MRRFLTGFNVSVSVKQVKYDEKHKRPIAPHRSVSNAPWGFVGFLRTGEGLFRVSIRLFQGRGI